jgi:hypothetical protein
MSYVVKNWKDHQHYKNRRPPWIKLHRTLLDDCDYLRLQPASRALAPLMWLLASEGINGVVEGEAAELAFRLRLTESEVQDGLNGLLSIGYIARYQDASAMLAPCKRETRPETETEKRQSESESEIHSPTVKEAFVSIPQPEPPAPPPPSKPIEPEDHPLTILAQKIRGCRPEYSKMTVAGLVHTLRYFRDDPRLEWLVGEWCIDHANALAPFTSPLASLRKALQDNLTQKSTRVREFGT